MESIDHLYVQIQLFLLLFRPLCLVTSVLFVLLVVINISAENI